MKRRSLIALGWCWLICWSHSLSGQSFFSVELEYQCMTRAYWLYLPSQYTGWERLPLVMNLHGFRSDPESQAVYSHLNELAEQEGFMVLYPQGTIGRTPWGEGLHWNVGFREFPDDVGFLGALLTEISQQYAADPTRIYVMGLSNGGMMAYELACQFPERIAAVGSVAGTMFKQQRTACQGSLAVPTILFHGTEDELIPILGKGRFLSSEEVSRFWALKNRCLLVEEVNALPNLTPTDQSQAEFVHYFPCFSQAEVMRYRIKGGGHTWPGSSVELATLGPTNQDIDATTLMWIFFQRFQRPAAYIPFPSLKTAAPCPAFCLAEAGSFQIRWEDQVPDRVALYTIDGQLLWEQTSPAADKRLEQTLAAGVYLLCYVVNGVIHWQKLMRWE
ncbi:MAG: PHB depolymerase family esterase [Bacteroidota bacterium]